MTRTRLLLVALFTPAALTAQSAASPPSLTAEVRASVMDSVVAMVTARYVDADTAKLIADALRKRIAARAYDRITNPAELADIVSRDLRTVNGDLHNGLRYAPPAAGPRPGLLPSDPRTVNFGMGRTEILEGNVGYLEITGFVGGQYRDAVVDALRLLSRTDALIIDLRRNGGGASDMSHFIFSHFLNATPVQTIAVSTRASSTPSIRMSLGEVPGPRRTDIPLYILTSEGTASAAEEFTFVLKNQKRAKTVGTRTAGAGHMVGSFPVGNGFAVSLSQTRVSDPETHKEWERVGVQPDIAVSPERALDAAHAAALQTIIAGAGESARTPSLKRLLETVEARGRAMPSDMAAIARFAGTYEGRIVTARDGRLWYTRRSGALPEPLVPISGNTYALGAVRMRFDEAGGAVKLTIEQADGTFLTIQRQ